MESQPNSGPSNGSSSSNTTPSTNGNNKRRHRPRNRNKTANANGNSNGQASENSSLTPSPSSTDNPHSPQHPRNRNRPSQRIQRADPSKVVRRPQRKNPKGLTKRSQEIEQLKRGYPSMFPLDPQAGTDDSSEAEKFWQRQNILFLSSLPIQTFLSISTSYSLCYIFPRHTLVKHHL